VTPDPISRRRAIVLAGLGAVGLAAGATGLFMDLTVATMSAATWRSATLRLCEAYRGPDCAGG
jgi:hypothetical protein